MQKYYIIRQYRLNAIRFMQSCLFSFLKIVYNTGTNILNIFHN